MTQLTNEIIIENLKNNTPVFNIYLLYLIGIALIAIVIYFTKMRDYNGNKGPIVVAVILLFFFGIPIWNGFSKYNAIQYAIENNSFEVVIDQVSRKASRTEYNDGDSRMEYGKYTSSSTYGTTERKNRQRRSTYTINFKNNGNIKVDESIYSNLNRGDSAYLIIAISKSGKKYVTNQIYPLDEYQYINP